MNRPEPKQKKNNSPALIVHKQISSHVHLRIVPVHNQPEPSIPTELIIPHHQRMRPIHPVALALHTKPIHPGHHHTQRRPLITPPPVIPHLEMPQAIRVLIVPVHESQASEVALEHRVLDSHVDQAERAQLHRRNEIVHFVATLADQVVVPVRLFVARL